jgi:hypothetical protein
MISVYALLCAATLMRSECTPATATDVIRMPDADNKLACMRDSLLTLAGLAIRPHASEYWKVVGAQTDELPNLAQSRQGHDRLLVLQARQRGSARWPTTTAPLGCSGQS